MYQPSKCSRSSLASLQPRPAKRLHEAGSPSATDSEEEPSHRQPAASSATTGSRSAPHAQTQGSDIWDNQQSPLAATSSDTEHANATVSPEVKAAQMKKWWSQCFQTLDVKMKKLFAKPNFTSKAIVANLKAVITEAEAFAYFPGHDIKAIALSRLTQADLVRLDVKATKYLANLDFKDQVWQTLKSMTICKDSDVVNSADHILKRATVLSKLLLDKTEGSARMIATVILIEIVHIMNMALCSGVLTAELQLSLKTKRKEPCYYESIDKTTVTALMGSVDFAVLSWGVNGQPASLQEETEVKEILKKMEDLDLKGEALRILKATVKVSFVEVKRADENLISHLPQVIGQCTVVAERSAGKEARNLIPFCLTTGIRWLFGALVTGEDGSKQCYVAPEVILDFNQNSLIEVLKLMLSWILMSDESIRKLFVDPKNVVAKPPSPFSWKDATEQSDHGEDADEDLAHHRLDEDSGTTTPAGATTEAEETEGGFSSAYEDDYDQEQNEEEVEEDV